MPARLHIGIDSDKAVVTPYGIKLRTGRARRHRTGSVVEFVPLAPSGRSRESRVTAIARLALPLIFVSAGLFGAGVPWWLPAAFSATLLGLLWRHQRRAAQHASFALPKENGRSGSGRSGSGRSRSGRSRGNVVGGANNRSREIFGGYEAHKSNGGESHVLWSSPERAAFVRAVRAARRVRRTWPGLAGMIDPVTADHSLTRALGDLAGVLARRQEIRQVRAQLAGVRPESVPTDSPALLALAEQRAHADELWRETGEQADSIVADIEGTALAGETFLHEQTIGETARRAELVLSGLRAPVLTTGTGTELADRTDAVISAYRSLAGDQR
jgi:hypothetical protein